MEFRLLFKALQKNPQALVYAKYYYLATARSKMSSDIHTVFLNDINHYEKCISINVQE